MVSRKDGAMGLDWFPSGIVSLTLTDVMFDTGDVSPDALVRLNVARRGDPVG
ncbi:hypothetical protein [Brevibacterium siliguriense]|nr:hypothetical protein [Brevibacterium siliguriense]